MSQSARVPERRNIFIAGCQKLGTNWRHRCLREHSIPEFGSVRANTTTVRKFSDYLEKNADSSRVVSCGQLAEWLEAGEPVPVNTLTISFDDGYRDVLDEAVPLLEKHNLPATLFITTGFARGDVLPYEYVLGQVVASSDGLVLDPAEPDRSFIRINDANREVVYNKLRMLVKFRPHEERMAFLRNIGAGATIDHWDASRLFLTEEEIVRLSAHPLIEFGAHTVSHPTLGALDSQALIRELRDSKVWLENLLDRPVELLAYPYGDHDMNVMMAARACGFRAAFGTAGAAGKTRPSSAILRIPRTDISDL